MGYVYLGFSFVVAWAGCLRWVCFVISCRWFWGLSCSGLFTYRFCELCCAFCWFCNARCVFVVVWLDIVF